MSLTELINRQLVALGLTPTDFYRALAAVGITLTPQAVDAWRKGSLVGDAHRVKLAQVLHLDLGQIQAAATVQAQQRRARSAQRGAARATA